MGQERRTDVAATEPKATSRERQSRPRRPAWIAIVVLLLALIAAFLTGRARDDVTKARFLEAIETGDAATVEDMIARGADPNAARVEYLYNGSNPVVRLMARRRLHAPLRVARRYRVYVHDFRTSTMHLALHDESLNALRLLLDRGADPGARDEQGQTALHWAAQARWREPEERGGSPVITHGAVADATGAAELLLEHGADINAQDNCDQTPLHEAVRSGTPEMTAFLLEHGADPDLGGLLDRTALCGASQWGGVDKAELLLKQGADPDLPDAHGMTPLHWAARQAHLEPAYVEITELLIEHGADPTLRDRQGRTPADVAAQTGATTLAQRLRDWAADRHAGDD